MQATGDLPRKAQSLSEYTPLRGGLTKRYKTRKSIGCLRETWVLEDSENTLDPVGFVINIIADILPPGFLPLPFALRSTGIVPFVLLLAGVYAASVFSMWCCGVALMLTGERTWRRQWVVLIGKGTSWIPVLILIITCFFNTLLMSCFSADVFSAVSGAPRWLCLLSFTAFPLVPLVCVKDLSGLTFTSALALVALAYTLFVMTLRALDGSYAEGGQFYHPKETAHTALPEPGYFEVGRGTINYLGYLVFSFLVHYNGCKFFREMKDVTTTSFLNATAVGMGITATFFGFMGWLGFETFKMHTSIAILTNYTPMDKLAALSSAAVAISLVLSYPLMFVGLREATMELLVMWCPDLETHLEEVRWFRLVALLLLTVLTVISAIVTDIEPVVTLTGCTCGVACVFIIPCVLCSKAMSECLDPRIRLITFMKVFVVFWTVVGAIVTANTLDEMINSDVDHGTVFLVKRVAFGVSYSTKSVAFLFGYPSQF